MSEFILMCGSLSRPSLPMLKWAKDPVVLVEPQQMADYKAVNPHLDYVTLQASGRGFSYMMNQMVKECLRRGSRYFIFTDDDVFGLKHRPVVSQKFQRVTPDTCNSVLQGLVDIVKDQTLGQLAISFSGQSWAAKKPYVEPTGSWGVYVCDAYAVQSVGGFDESLTIFADWDMSAKLIKAGYRCLRTNLVTFEHKMKGMSGGAEALYKQKDRIKASADTLGVRYGAAARVVFVPEHDQYEIRFNWKKLTE
jgi:hypothetical protein